MKADWLRKNPPADSIEEDDLLASEEEEPDGAVELLRRGLRRLDPDRRRLLTLRYVDDLELSEIAQILAVPEGTVKSRLHHARSQLRDIIERMES